MEYKSHKGFTLVELLISVGIIGLVSGIVLVKYSAFDSTILLKSSAYEIALALHEAQVKSVSVTYQSSTADYPFGVTFTPTQKKYNMFRFASSTGYPYYDVSDPDPDASVVSTSTIGRTMKIKEVCYYVSSWVCSANSTYRLDISFRRPEYKALINASPSAFFSGVQGTIKKAQIKVDSANGSGNVFVVEVSGLGQISVFKQ